MGLPLYENTMKGNAMTINQLVELQKLRTSYLDKGNYISADIVTALICSTEYFEDPSDPYNTKRGVQHLASAMHMMLNEPDAD